MIELHSRQDKGFLIHGTDHVMQFPAGEQHLVLNAPEAEHPFLAIMRGASAEDLVQAGMWVDSVHQRGDKATLAIPYLPGARQDRGNPFGAKVYAEIINSLGADLIIAVDPHSDVMPSLVSNLRTYPVARLISRFLAYRIGGERQAPYVGIIAPDEGARKRAGSVARRLRLPLYQALKHRDFATGRLSGFSCEDLPAEGRLLVVDDICDGGGTFRGLAEATGLGPDRLDLWVTHGVFSGKAGLLNEHFGTIHTTDSHPGHTNPEVNATIHPLAGTLIQEALS